ncbi:hypothetical protein GW17_00043257, partial [Ensete ventricosum]
RLPAGVVAYKGNRPQLESPTEVVIHGQGRLQGWPPVARATCNDGAHGGNGGVQATYE